MEENVMENVNVTETVPAIVENSNNGWTKIAAGVAVLAGLVYAVVKKKSKKRKANKADEQPIKTDFTEDLDDVE